MRFIRVSAGHIRSPMIFPLLLAAAFFCAILARAGAPVLTGTAGAATRARAFAVSNAGFARHRHTVGVSYVSRLLGHTTLRNGYGWVVVLPLMLR
uniref:Putative secreted protein n=1 Tax=Anopheles darlingi TaxID=43151 RepID=A0A2M4D2N5_ANODA